MSKEAPDTVQGDRVFPRESDLEAFAKVFAASVATPLVVWLEGDLGAGKTTFARGLIHALGYAGRVKSPTYGLLECYQLAALQVLHMDLYRIGDPGELEFLGIADLLDERTVLLVEWPDKGGDYLPEPDFRFCFSYAPQGRGLRWLACSERGRLLAADVVQNLSTCIS